MSRVDQRASDISGTKVVYEEAAHDCFAGGYWVGCSDIYMYDFETGETSVVSSKAVGQNNPKIEGDKVVWLEPSTDEIRFKDLNLE